MRAVLFLCFFLAACALPDLDVPEGEPAARAEYPELVPFDEVTDRAAAMPEADPEIGPNLGERAAALRDRAGRIETPPPDAGAADRAARLRQRADGLR